MSSSSSSSFFFCFLLFVFLFIFLIPTSETSAQTTKTKSELHKLSGVNLRVARDNHENLVPYEWYPDSGFPGRDDVLFSCVPSGLLTAVPINSSYSGLGFFLYNQATKEMSYKIFHNAVSVGLFAQVSIGTPGQFKTPAYTTPPTSSPLSGTISLNLTASQDLFLLNGSMYWELRTTKNPDGELRCQIVRNAKNNLAEFIGWLINKHSVANTKTLVLEKRQDLVEGEAETEPRTGKKEKRHWTGGPEGVASATYNFTTQTLTVKVIHNLPNPGSIVQLIYKGDTLNETACTSTTSCSIVYLFPNKTLQEYEDGLTRSDFIIKVKNNDTSSIYDYLASPLLKIDGDTRKNPCNGPCPTYFWPIPQVYKLFDPWRDEQEVFIMSGSGLNTLNTTCYQCIYPFNSTYSASGVFLYDTINSTLSWLIHTNSGNQTIFNQLSFGSKGNFRTPWVILSTSSNFSSPMVGNRLPVNSTVHDRLKNATIYYELRTLLNPDGELRGQFTNNTANLTTADFAGILKHPSPLFVKYNGTVIGNYNFTLSYLVVKVNHNLVAPLTIELLWMKDRWNATSLNLSSCITTKCNMTLNITHMSMEDGLFDEEFVVKISNASTYIASRVFHIDGDYRVIIDTSLDGDQILAIVLLSMVVLAMLLIGLIYRMLVWRTLIRNGQAYLIVPKIIREGIAAGSSAKKSWKKRKGRRGEKKAMEMVEIQT